MSKLTKGLNPEQKKAVETTEGPVLVLAGAGSGKTRVLTHRIAYIIEQNLARPEEILAVTFTNKAAGEMKERINDLVSLKTGPVNINSIVPWCGTFHSICVRILRIETKHTGVRSSFSIYDSNDSVDVVKEAMDRLMISKKDFNPRAIKSTISSAKNELLNSVEYAKFADGYFQETVARIYPEYQKILLENQALDFDDLIMVTTKLFDTHPQLLEKYQWMFKYIHVDEYQDTNHAQYYLIKQLTESKNENVCVVGDDDQSIYGFRGANIKNILNFEKDYPKATIVKLEQNYRSTQNILDASHSIVNKNENRRDKKLWTEQSGGESINIHRAQDETDEAEWVATECAELIEGKSEPEDIAILYRTNAQSRTIEEAFIRNAIPYKVVGNIRFYDRKEIKDILAYLRMVSNPDDELSLSRIINTPRRGIGAKTFEKLKQTAKSLEQKPIEFLVNETESIDNPKIKRFAEIAKSLYTYISDSTVTEFIKFVLERSGYIEFLDDGTLENQSRIENIKELLSVASKYDKLIEDSETTSKEALGKFLEDVALVEQQSNEDNPNSVTLMTVHASKGLEFKNIFIIGMEEMLFPHSRSYYDPKEMEEERRLAYVAITRAKESVKITHTESRIYFGKLQSNPLSRFVSDIPEGLVDITASSGTVEPFEVFDEYNKEDEDVEEYVMPTVKVGEKVKHQVFGKGVIKEINDSTIIIDFGPGKGEKELAKEYAILEKV